MPGVPFTERHLCDRLRAAAGRLGWVAYPEVSGWDVLLVMETGEQIGVQAKLRASLEVLAQAVKTPERSPGPDMRAVLVVPGRGRDGAVVWGAMRDFMRVAEAARVLVWTPGDLTGTPLADRHMLEAVRDAPRWNRTARCWLPPLTDLPAGVPNPRTISRWRCNAARLCVELRGGLRITHAQFIERDVGHMSSWRRYLVRVPGSRPALYGAPDPTNLPDVKFPHVHAALGLPAPGA